MVVPRQHALRGHAQLLLFVRRGCGSCEALIERADTDFAAMDAIDIRLIAAVGDGLPVPVRGQVRTHPSGALAEALGIPP
ncbi:MAG: hypothetical protein PIR02_08845 [Microbacterium enclense]